MRVTKYLVLAMAFLALLAYVAGFFLPDSARVERYVDIGQPPSRVFSVVNTPRDFNRWSPWYEKYKRFGATYSYHGPASGPGASIRWQAPGSVPVTGGYGEMRITASTPYERVRYALLFEGREPAVTTFDIEALPDGGSRVTWSYEVDFGGSVIERYFGLILDRAVGPDYETGLQNLKKLLENTPAARIPQANANG